MKENNSPLGREPFDDEEDEGDELEEFLFFKRLEENDGKVSKSMAAGGCFSVLPIVALIIAALFFLLRYMYL